MTKQSFSVEWEIQWPMAHEWGGAEDVEVLRSLRDAQVRVREWYAIDHDGRRVPDDHEDAGYWWARVIVDVEGEVDEDADELGFHPVDASADKLSEIHESIETLDWAAA